MQDTRVPSPRDNPIPAAPISLRVVAGAIDLLVAFGTVALLVTLLSRRAPFAKLGVLVLGVGPAVLIAHFYLALKDAVSGKSIGKVVAGLVAYNERQSRATGFVDSFLRNWYLGVPLIGPTLVVAIMALQILRGNRRLGELATHTVVITDSQYQRRR